MLLKTLLNLEVGSLALMASIWASIVMPLGDELMRESEFRVERHRATFNMRKLMTKRGLAFNCSGAGRRSLRQQYRGLGASMDWRERIVNELLPKAEAASRSICLETIHVEFDWRNAVFRVLVPEEAEVDDDEISNAVRTATGVDAHVDAPPLYPFTLHTRRLPGLVKRLGVCKQTWFRIDTSELQGLREGYDKLAAVALEFTRCATFALGGMPVLRHIARNTLPEPSQANTEHGQRLRLDALAVARSKFHILEGLNWEVTDPTPEEKFHTWLASLPVNERLLIIDTTFSGGGINRIVNSLLCSTARPGHIEIHGLLDSSRTPVLPDARIREDSRGTVHIVLHPVPKLVTEDHSDLIGYDSLRSCGGIEAVWGSATIELMDGDQISTIIGTSNVAHVIDSLVRTLPTSVTLDDDFAAASRYLALLTKLGNEAEHERGVIRQACEAGLLEREEANRELEGLDKRMNEMTVQGRKLLKRILPTTAPGSG